METTGITQANFSGGLDQSGSCESGKNVRIMNVFSRHYYRICSWTGREGGVAG